MHVVILSGMDADDTSAYLRSNGFKNAYVFQNQICRFTKILGGKTAKRITVWVMLNTKMTQYMLKTIEYRIQNLIFLYSADKPLTLLRAMGWWKMTKSGNFNMCLCSTVFITPSSTVAYDRLIEHIADQFVDVNNEVIPHYAIGLNLVIKLFLAA